MSGRRELALVKGKQRFIFWYEAGEEERILESFVVLANDRASEFDWFDAAVLSFQLSKQLVEEADALLSPKEAGARQSGSAEAEAYWGSA